MLTTNRLILRPARLNDAEDLFAAYGDPDAMRFWSTPPDQSSKDTAQRVAELCALPDPVCYFVIEHNARAIGTVGIHEGDEIGFMLSKAYWRKGLMSEALSALIPWLFETLDITRITADVDPQNLASAELLKSLGFVETGRAKNTFCVSGIWSDSVYLALQRPS